MTKLVLQATPLSLLGESLRMCNEEGTSQPRPIIEKDNNIGKMFSKPVRKLPEPALPRLNVTVAHRGSPDTERVKSKRESAECRTFRKCFAYLADGISNPGWLAIQLYSRELIGRDLRTEAQKQAIAEQVKIEMLLSAVEDQIATSPATKFTKFLDILQNEPSLQHLATRLENNYCELSGLCTASVPPPTSTPSSPPLATCTQSSLPLPTFSPEHPTGLIPPARNNVLCSLEHTTQPSDFQPDRQTSVEHQHVHFTQSTTPHNSGGQSSAVDTYASYLKSVYTREKLPIYDKWPQVKSKKYINLALIQKEDITKREADQFTTATIHGNIDDIKKTKRAVDIGEIAQLPDGSQPKCIIVEGAPGVGKSTFAWKLCRKWGKGKLLQQYKLVVLLRLRDKNVRAAKIIPDLFQYHDDQIQQAAVEEIKRTGGKGVLLLFEGYDELPEKFRTKISVFLDVITGRELPEATVLITSRPWASEFLHRECKKHISQHIEILGFTKDNIQLYLESTTASDPSLQAGLKNYISCYPHIGSLMYIPLNSAIVVEVYRNSRKDKTVVPKTMTELYSSLVRSLLLRHLLDHPVHGKNRRWRVRSFSDLPQDVYQQLCELGRIAYEGILHRQQVIFSNLPEDFETLGLMHCSPELFIDEGAAVSYNFLHLTVQEYLAAFHLSQQPVENQIALFKQHNISGPLNTRFHMVLLFVCGLRKFSGYPSEVLSTLCVVKLDSQKSFNVSDSVIREVIDPFHWLFEAHDNDVVAGVLGSADIHFHIPVQSQYLFSWRSNEFNVVTPFDYFVLGYCVSHSKCTWRLDLKNCHIGDEEVEMLVRGAMEEPCCTGGISEIDLSNRHLMGSRNKITSEGMKQLLKFPKQLINKLETLNLAMLGLDSKCCAALAHLIPHVPHLKTLILSDNGRIGHGGTAPLIESLAAHKSLEELNLHDAGTGVMDCKALGKLLSSSKSLKSLHIGCNELSSLAVELVISGLRHNTTLKSLVMGKPHMATSLAPFLQNAKSLASALSTDHTLTFLRLPQCSIDSDAFAEMLGKNHTITYLDLRRCNIDSDGACQFASALCINNTLQILQLWGNPIGFKGAAAFAEMLCRNKSLKELDLRDDSIGEEGTQKLIDSFTHNATMKMLGLPKIYQPSSASSEVDSRINFC